MPGIGDLLKPNIKKRNAVKVDGNGSDYTEVEKDVSRFLVVDQ